jgi:hypothetical protein
MKDLLKEEISDDNRRYQRIDGYVLLVNDLDFTGVEYKPFCGFLELNRDFGGRCGWNATFEGNYKVLKNIKLGSADHKDWNSIFGNVGWDAEIRNLAIVDCTFAENATGAVLADYFHGIASNIFISTTLVGVDNNDWLERKCCGFSIATPYKYATVEEVTIVVKEALQISPGCSCPTCGQKIANAAKHKQMQAGLIWQNEHTKADARSIPTVNVSKCLRRKLSHDNSAPHAEGLFCFHATIPQMAKASCTVSNAARL